jgi:NitT/TauT family transport system substrate-binding protein
MNAARAVAFAALLLGVVACAPAAPAPPVRPNASATPPASAVAAGPSVSAASPPPTVAPARPVAFAAGSASATNGPLWVGADHGIFLRYGLDVEVTTMAAATATQAVQSGSVPFAGTSASTIAAIAGGARDLVFIAGGVNKPIFEIVAQSDVTRVEDLRGQTVAGSTSGAAASIALVETLRRHGLEPDRDVGVLYLREQPAMLGGLITGQVAAAVLASPFNKQARDQGLRLLVDLTQSDVEVFGQSITTTRSLVERDYDLARRFVMAYVEAIEFCRRQPAATIESILRGTRGDNRADAEEAYALYRTAWEPTLSERALRTLLDNADVPGARDLRPDDVFDYRILRELESNGWLAQHLGPP